MSREVGRLVGIWRYPVKSMAGEPLDGVDVSWAGLAGDRRWAFVRPGIPYSGFPWLTIRQRPDMSHYKPRFLEPLDPDGSSMVVQTPAGVELDIADATLASELEGARVIKQNRGIFDTMPLSLISTQTVAAIGKSIGTELNALRFRPNMVIAATDDAPFIEEEWIGMEITVGSMRMRVDQRDKRCVMINVDPATNDRNPDVLRTVAQQRDACLGVYGSTVQPGRIATGDSVFLSI